MATRVGIRELREGLSRALRRVQAGETIEVTAHGKPVARIVPVSPSVPDLVDLVGEGKVRPPRAIGPRPAPADLPSTMTSEEAIDRLR